MEIATDSVVFAMGGIENSRQLLHFHRQLGDRLYDAALPVGQYWMEHPHFNLGEALVSRRIQNMRSISLTGSVQKRLGILGCGFRIDIQGGTATGDWRRTCCASRPIWGGTSLTLQRRTLFAALG